MFKRTKRSMAFALSGWVLILAGCQEGLEFMSAEQSTRKVVVQVVEHVRVKDDSWRGFEGVYRCVVWDPESSGLAKGQGLNIVAATEEIRLKGGFLHEHADVRLLVGNVYRVVVTENLPKGWDAIAVDFRDQRIGLLALTDILGQLDVPTGQCAKQKADH